MGEELKSVRLKNGMTVHIAHEYDDVGDNPLYWRDVDYYLYGGRNYVDVVTGETTAGKPDWSDWEEKFDEVVRFAGRNPAGSDVVSIIGLEWVVMYDLLFSTYPAFQKGHDQCMLDPWQHRALERATSYVRAHYHTCLVSRYEHGMVSYNRGAPTCRWDAGYCGFAIVKKDRMTAEEFADEVDRTLATYTDWSNGEIYSVICVNAYGDCVDACSGYIGWDHALSGLDDMSNEYQDKTDCSLLQMLTVERRADTISRMCALLEVDTLNQGLLDLGISLCHTEVAGEDREVMADVDHYRVVRLFTTLDGDLSDAAKNVVTLYCLYYMERTLEDM